jgi:hypothetical protein
MGIYLPSLYFFWILFAVNCKRILRKDCGTSQGVWLVEGVFIGEEKGTIRTDLPIKKRATHKVALVHFTTT